MIVDPQTNSSQELNLHFDLADSGEHRMKKRSKGPSATGATPGKEALVLKRKTRRGRKKEKIQISVRIDKASMDLAYDTVKETGIRITDLLERGLILAIRETKQVPPGDPTGLRFLWEHVGALLTRRLVNTVALQHITNVRPLTGLEKAYRDFWLRGIDSLPEWEGYQEALASAAPERETAAAS